MPRNKKIQVLTGVAEVFGFTFTDLSIEIYLEALEDLSVEDLKRILSYGIRANLWKFMPRPGEILSVIRLSEDSKSALSAKSEFEGILSVVRRQGRNGCPELSETGASSLRQIGGMNRIADATDADLVWIRKDFEANYELNSKKSVIDIRKLRLAGKESHEEMKRLYGDVSESLRLKP